jgi:hypothetical protein
LSGKQRKQSAASFFTAQKNVVNRAWFQSGDVGFDRAPFTNSEARAPCAKGVVFMPDSSLALVTLSLPATLHETLKRAPAEAGSVFSHCGDCIGKGVTKDWLCKHGGIGDLLVDELDGIGVTVSRNKNNRHLANHSKPSSNFDAFAASFETNIDEGNIGLIVHSK